MPRVYLQFVFVVFPDHTHLLFFHITPLKRLLVLPNSNLFVDEKGSDRKTGQRIKHSLSLKCNLYIIGEKPK